MRRGREVRDPRARKEVKVGGGKRGARETGEVDGRDRKGMQRRKLSRWSEIWETRPRAGWNIRSRDTELSSQKEKLDRERSRIRWKAGQRGR